MTNYLEVILGFELTNLKQMTNNIHLCPACEENNAGPALSRYVNVHLCHECAISEAFEGFFWEENAIEKELVDANETAWLIV